MRTSLRSDDAKGTSSMRKLGYIVIVAAMVAYAIAAVFLDFYVSQGMPDGMRGVSHFDLLTLSDPGSRGSRITGAIVTVFGGAFLIAATAALGLTRSRDERTMRATVTVGVGVWSTFVLGPVITLAARDLPVGSGFWVEAACGAVAIVGTGMLWGRRSSEPPDAAVPDEAAASVSD
jgi:hypothetical protein